MAGELPIPHAEQKLNGAPLDCHWLRDGGGTLTFDCQRCERTVCYCMGCADDAPALCDDCYAELGCGDAR